MKGSAQRVLLLVVVVVVCVASGGASYAGSDIDEFLYSRFVAQVDRSLDAARQFLHSQKAPILPLDPAANLTYYDKYIISEAIGNLALNGQVNVLLREIADLSSEQFHVLRDQWVKEQGRFVKLRFNITEQCTFHKQQKVQVESPTRVVVESGSLWGSSSTKTVTTITEYLWNYKVHYQMSFVGTDQFGDEQTMSVYERVGKGILKTQNNEYAPLPEKVLHDPVDLDVTWLLSQMDHVNLTIGVQIDRHKATTPRRNAQVDAILDFLASVRVWSGRALSLLHGLRDPSSHSNFAVNDDAVFVPVLPLLENDGRTVVVDQQKLLEGQAKTLKQLEDKLKEQLSDAPVGEVTSYTELFWRSCLMHARTLSQAGFDGFNYLDYITRKQLVEAIGKEISLVDFAKYMEFHGRKVFKEEYQPKPFSYAVRRPDHYPEGEVSLQANYEFSEPGKSEQILTLVNQSSSPVHIEFNINAATKVHLLGNRYIHSWMSHQFGGEQVTSLLLNARARQFSSFIMLVGNVISSSVFQPKGAMLIQNKDDLKIPLLLETIPTAAEFRSAIESLSPEQQAFAKAYRQMQLESTMFGIVIIQIKPQLERLLNIPADSLTKEIKLTQDLMELFIKYQIPSDLLSYSGPESEATSVKLDAVKTQVLAMQGVIEGSKKKILEEKDLENKFNKKEVDREQVLIFAHSASHQVKRMMTREAESAMFEFSFAGRDAYQQAAPDSSASSSSASTEPPVLKTQSDQERQSDEAFDITAMPKLLEKSFDALGSSYAVRPTILSLGGDWDLSFQKTLLSKVESRTLGAAEQKTEMNAVIDLLDALSRSGSLRFEDASMHVVIVSTHSFEESVLDTVVRNVNPIERLEKSMLTAACVLHSKQPSDLLQPKTE